VLLTFREMWTAWKGVTATKPRTVDATRGMLNMLAAFLGHDDAGRVTRDDLRRWRDQLKADGLSSNTWNNRLSLIGQVCKWAVADERLAADPTEGLRLPKGKPNGPLPYSDKQSMPILTRPFGNDADATLVALASGVWSLAVHENTEGKSVMTGTPRNVVK
jgi:site-specific recombinase XerC